MKRFFALFALQSILIQIFAQIPNGYYSNADGSCGASLKTELYKIINQHKTLSYDALWTAFRTTDRRADGKVWDMYSSVTNYVFGSDQGKNYSKEGDSYNREHSFPKSWFNKEYPMYTDLFHLYPTDGYINGRRSNYPYGETDGSQYTSKNGHSKLGPSKTPGYSGIVFEPADEYKGDLARTYFYMATCYENQIQNWNSPMLAKKSYPAYAEWAVDLLLRWAQQDPVSEKEINRNNEVYKLQKNRNPFIDFPGLEEYIWGSKMDVIFDSENYNQEGGVITVKTPVFSPASGEVAEGTQVTISTKTVNAVIVYSINNGETVEGASPVTVTVDGDMEITAYAKLGDKQSEPATATYTIAEGPVVPDPTVEYTFSAVSSTADLAVGAQYILVSEEKAQALSEQGKDIRKNVNVTIESGKITTAVNKTGMPYTLVLGGSNGQYTFYDATSKCYLALNNDNNKLHTADKGDSKNAQWQIDFEADGMTITSCAYDNRIIQYNAGSPRFACYKTTSKQQPVRLFKMQQSTGIQEVTSSLAKPVNVYTISGFCVKKQVKMENALQGLPSGVYIINGKKVLK